MGVAGDDNFVNSAWRSTLLDDRLLARMGGGGRPVEMFVGLDGAVIPLLEGADADDANDPLPAGASPFPACKEEETGGGEDLSMAGNGAIADGNELLAE